MGEMIMFATTMLWADKQELLNIKEGIESQLKELELYEDLTLTDDMRLTLLNKKRILSKELVEVNTAIKKIDDKFQIVIKYILHAFRFMI